MSGSSSVSPVWLARAGVVLMLVAVAAAAEEQGSTPVVATQQGLVSGVVEKSTKGRTFYSYYSIPYAQPPVGPLRFKLPVEAKGWDGVRKGTQQPAPCVQISLISVIQGQPPIVLGQEDCLYINVFTPKVSGSGSGLPVLVFIHGGGYIGGSMAIYQPYALLNQDIVLVTLQYRLGLLGFLSTEDDELPGNLALHDQLAVLQWVARNIINFGGDPNSVTLSGQSVGGSSTHLLLLSSKTRGLVSRAIMQSGSGLCFWALGAAHRQVAYHLGFQVGCGDHLGSSHSLVECLRGVDTEQLVYKIYTYMQWYFLPILLGPRVDGDILTAAPEILARQGTHGAIPIILGTTAHDGGFLALPIYKREDLHSALTDHFQEIGPLAAGVGAADEDPQLLARRVFQYYLGGVNLQKEDAENVVQMFTDRYFRVCNDLTAQHHARAAPGLTFSYTLSYRGQHSLGDDFNLNVGRHWVTHSDEMFYLFPGDPSWLNLTSPPDLTLRDTITQLWANFAATGNPTPDASLGFVWEATNATHLRHLVLSPSPTMVQETGRQVQVREFWASLPTHQNKLLRGNDAPAPLKPTLVQYEAGSELRTPDKLLIKTEL